MSLKPLVNSQRLWVTGGVPWRSAVSLLLLGRTRCPRSISRTPAQNCPTTSGCWSATTCQTATRSFNTNPRTWNSKGSRVFTSGENAGSNNGGRTTFSETVSKKRSYDWTAREAPGETQEGCHALNGPGPFRSSAPSPGQRAQTKAQRPCRSVTRGTQPLAHPDHAVNAVQHRRICRRQARTTPGRLAKRQKEREVSPLR